MWASDGVSDHVTHSNSGLELVVELALLLFLLLLFSLSFALVLSFFCSCSRPLALDLVTALNSCSCSNGCHFPCCFSCFRFRPRLLIPQLVFHVPLALPSFSHLNFQLLFSAPESTYTTPWTLRDDTSCQSNSRMQF